MKIKVDKLYVDKLVPIPVNSSKLSDVVKSDAIKKYVYDAKMKNIKDKIPNITNLATNTKVNKVKSKIPNITNVATAAAAVTAVENKITNVSN